MATKKAALDPDLFVTHIMRGKRFEEHRVPVEALGDLAAYQELITDLARDLFLRGHQGRIRVPKGFEGSFQLSIDSIEEGSVQLALVRSHADGPRTIDLFPD